MLYYTTELFVRANYRNDIAIGAIADSIFVIRTAPKLDGVAITACTYLFLPSTKAVRCDAMYKTLLISAFYHTAHYGASLAIATLTFCEILFSCGIFLLFSRYHILLPRSRNFIIEEHSCTISHFRLRRLGRTITALFEVRAVERYRPRQKGEIIVSLVFVFVAAIAPYLKYILCTWF